MTPESSLDALRRLDRETTPGPWTYRDEPDKPLAMNFPKFTPGEGVANCELIITLRNTLPALLRLVDAAKMSAQLAPRVPNGNAFGHPWMVPNPVIAALAELTTPAPAEET